MRTTSKPVDVILSLLPSLSKQEREKLKRKLGMTELSPCQRLGHAGKLVPVKPAGWFEPAKMGLVCTRCGEHL